MTNADTADHPRLGVVTALDADLWWLCVLCHRPHLDYEDMEYLFRSGLDREASGRGVCCRCNTEVCKEKAEGA